MCPLILLPSTRLLMPPARTMPLPIDAYSSTSAGALKLLLFSTRLLMIVSPSCWGLRSESRVLEAMPHILFRELELTVANHAIAIPATNGNICGFYCDGFVVSAVWTRTRSYRDQVSGFGGIYGGLYRGIRLWDT